MSWASKAMGWVVGKIIKGKLKLKEDKDMDEKKPWYTSKTVITSIVVALISAYNTIGVANFGLPVIPEWVYTILGAIGIYTRVVAEKKIG